MHGVINPIYWLYALRLLCPHTSLVFRNALGGGCAEKAAALAQELEPVVLQLGARFLDAGRVPGVEVHPLDGIHLTRSAHAALAQALVEVLKT